MRIALSALVSVTVLVGNSTTKAVAMSAIELSSHCKKANSAYDIACVYFIAGVTEGLMGAQIFAEKGSRTCFPTNIGGHQARLIVEKFMNEHPEKLNTHVSIL